jgi:hypothetical protein
VRRLLAYGAFGAALVAAAVAASMVLLSSTGGDAQIGRLSPVAPLPPPATALHPVTTTPAAPAKTSRHNDRHGGGESDD